MKTKTIHYRIGLFLGIMLSGLLCGCADDDGPATGLTRHELKVGLGYRQFTADDTRAATRALPTGFEPYTPTKQIQGFLTFKAADHPTLTTPISCIFDYAAGTENQWVSSIPLETGNYYLYGYLPKEQVGSNVTIEPLGSDYTQGAVLTLTNLNAVSPDDICVIVGAQQYSGSSVPEDMTNALGKFLYQAGDTNHDNIYLLVDHIYAGMEIQMRVHERYSSLRMIKVRRMTLEPDAGNGNVVKTVNATVTIKANENGEHPLQSVVFSEATTGTDPTPAVIYEGEGKALTTAYQPFLGCLCPTTAKADSKYLLKTTYDVYDDTGTLLISEGRTATNAITLRSALTAGTKFTLNITVAPTYLYVLADPDLDNPTLTIE